MTDERTETVERDMILLSPSSASSDSVNYVLALTCHLLRSLCRRLSRFVQLFNSWPLSAPFSGGRREQQKTCWYADTPHHGNRRRRDLRLCTRWLISAHLCSHRFVEHTRWILSLTWSIHIQILRTHSITCWIYEIHIGFRRFLFVMQVNSLLWGFL